ncbi:MAG: HEAT repeat domain-containing protein [Candidatus Hodarchaeota archaeon]
MQSEAPSDYKLSHFNSGMKSMRPEAKDVLDLLTPLTDDSSVDVRRGASLAIAAIATALPFKDQREALWSLLEHPSWAVRRSAGMGLGLILKKSSSKFNKEVSEKLFQLTNDRDYSVKWGAGVGLGLALPKIFSSLPEAERYIDTLIQEGTTMASVARGVCFGLGMAIIDNPDSYAFSLLRSIIKNESRVDRLFPYALQGLSYGTTFLRSEQSQDTFTIFQEDLVQNPAQLGSVYGLGYSTMKREHVSSAIETLKHIISTSSDWRLKVSAGFSLIVALSISPSSTAIEEVSTILASFPERALEAAAVCIGFLSTVFKHLSQKNWLLNWMQQYKKQKNAVSRGLGIALGLLGDSQDILLQYLDENADSKSGALLGLALASNLSHNFLEAQEIIMPYLNHLHSTVRWSAAYALALLTLETVSDSIPIEVFLGVGEATPGWWIRGITLTSIGLMKQRENREIIILDQLNSNPSSYFDDLSPLIRACALRSYFQSSILASEKNNLLKNYLHDIDPLVGYVAADLLRKQYLNHPEAFSGLLLSLDVTALSRLGEVSRQSLFQELSSPLFQKSFLSRLKCAQTLEKALNFMSDFYAPSILKDALLSENDPFIKSILEKILIDLQNYVIK